MVRPASSLLLILLAAACARSEDPSVVGNSIDLQAVEQVRTPEQDDQAVALGDWRDTYQDESSALEFGPAGAPPLFSLRCDPRQSVNLQRHGTASAGDLPMMLISVDSETRRLAVTSVPGPPPMLRAALAPSDQLIEQLEAAETPITIRVGDAPPLVLPPSPAVGAFLDRCASGTRAPRGAAAENASAPVNEAAPSANVAAPAQ